MKSCWQVAHQFKISIENFLLLDRNALSFYVSENFIICVWVSSNELSTNSAVAQINSKFCKNRESITIFEFFAGKQNEKDDMNVKKKSRIVSFQN